MKVISEKFVSYPKAKKILEEREKEGELSYEQKSSLEHLRKFSKLEDDEKISEELHAIEKLREDLIVKIINNIPKTAEDVKVLFQKDVIDLSDEDIAKIIEVTKKYPG
ncbi:MAG: DNA-directed RNA polymerase subunit F [Candidatus Aenigmarchaeota archaeon]|nr:DNA-directed RNA polymerase subunit F [Candidatus Aenigmarchaeota archaeon]